MPSLQKCSAWTPKVMFEPHAAAEEAEASETEEGSGACRRADVAVEPEVGPARPEPLGSAFLRGSSLAEHSSHSSFGEFVDFTGCTGEQPRWRMPQARHGEQIVKEQLFADLSILKKDGGPVTADVTPWSACSSCRHESQQFVLPLTYRNGQC